MKNEGDEDKIAYIVKPIDFKYYGNVSVHDKTLDKLQQYHPEEFKRLPEVYKTIESPDRVYQSKTNPRSIIVVNDKVTSTGGSPLWAIIKRVSSDEAILTSAYFCRTNNPGTEL